jgi:hypothetical protein
VEFWQMFKYGTAIGQAGVFQYNGQYSSLAGELPDTSRVADLADFLQGNPYLAYDTKQWVYGYAVGGNFTNLFAQDDFKISPDLTINYGLRWEFRRPFRDKGNALSVLVPTGPLFTPGNAITVAAGPDSLNGKYCTDPYYSYLKTSDGRCLFATNEQRAALGFTGRAQDVLQFPNWKNFAPRLGIAWRPTHSDKLVIRTGYGLFYDTSNYNYLTAGHFDPAFIANVTYTTTFGAPPPLGPTGSPTNIQSAFSAGAIPPLVAQLYQTDWPPYSPTPLVQEWSFGIQSQLAQNLALDVSYIGNKGDHLTTLYDDGNQPLPGVGPLQPRRPYPDYGLMQYEIPTTISRYHSLQAKITKRFSGGLQFGAAYTYAKALDDNEGGDNSYAQQNTNNIREGEYGRSINDVRQRLAVNYVWQLPFGRGRHFLRNAGILDYFLGGWQFTGILSLQTGFPLTVTSSLDYSNTGSLGPRPDRVCDGKGAGTVSAWFNNSCFSTTALAAALASGNPRFGTSGRNILDGPGLQNLDLGFLKTFRMSDRFNLQFRAEAFNALNHANFSAPNTKFGTSTFGVITAAGLPRDIQLALKLAF